MADLITAPHVVVDLCPYADEAELIRRYGVDLQFLLALRDRKLITIAANADVGDTKNVRGCTMRGATINGADWLGFAPRRACRGAEEERGLRPLRWLTLQHGDVVSLRDHRCSRGSRLGT
jgi:hypothetical protein